VGHAAPAAHAGSGPTIPGNGEGATGEDCRAGIDALVTVLRELAFG